jgi:transposase
MSNNIKYNSPKWFNSYTAKLLDNFNQYDKSNFKQDINIKAKIMKTCTLPKFNMETPLSINKQVDNIFRDWSNNKSSLNTTFKKFSKLNTVIRVKNKYILDLNIEQKATIQSWIVECKKLYNICLDKQNQDNTLFNKGYKSIKKGIFDDVYQDFKKPAPYDVLTDEIRVFDSNLKSCRTNYKNGYINQFTLKPKSFKNENYSLLIPYKSIFKNGIFKNILGEINNFSLDTLPSHDSRLYYNARNNTYSLNIPEDTKIKKLDNRESVCAIDPGEKNFIAFYGSQSFGYIGKDIRIPLLRIRNRISKYQKILSKNINKNGKSIKNKKSLKSKIKKLYQRSKNIVKELHNQSANFLCKNYDNILIPKFETQKMIRTKKSFKEYKNDFINQGQSYEEKKKKAKEFTKNCRLSKSVKYVLNNLSHYSFRQHLLNKSQEHGCECNVVTEEFTSKTCSFCGHISDTYEKRLKICNHCNITIDRDLNGAKNILIKNTKIIGYNANSLLLGVRK